jgi:hypothetical protein
LRINFYYFFPFQLFCLNVKKHYIWIAYCSLFFFLSICWILFVRPVGCEVESSWGDERTAWPWAVLRLHQRILCQRRRFRSLTSRVNTWREGWCGVGSRAQEVRADRVVAAAALVARRRSGHRQDRTCWRSKGSTRSWSRWHRHVVH